MFGRMMGRLPEIVAPAGNLASGLYALMGGADAVYFGLPRFSARKAAENLTLSDVRRLKGVAALHGKKIYAAINTIIAEDEWADAERAVAEAALADVDGIIIQDLGLADFVRQAYPQMSLHGSTQLAVHNAPGLEAAAELGFRRVVLSRELTLDEIDGLRGVAATVEREVFVHGALCYGFSGLCLASSHLTGRSGNRGECAQICRSWFENGRAKGYFFSAVDLKAGELIHELISRGVSALKIEGRLKSSAYAFHTAAYYRALLDGDADKAAYHEKKSALCFARPQASGFLKSPKKEPLINAAYPSHMGIPGATVVAVKRGRTTLRALTELSGHDRLFRLPSAPPDEGETLVLSVFWKNNKKVRVLRRGETAEVDAATTAPTGAVLMKTLAHDIHLKALAKGAYPEYKKPLPLFASVNPQGLSFRTEWSGEPLVKTYAVPLEKSKGERRFDSVIDSLFSSYAAAGFCFRPVQSDGSSSNLPVDMFVPPSALKRVRNDFYQTVAAQIFAGLFRPTEDECLHFEETLPARSRISYADGFAFIAEDSGSQLKDAPLIDGVRYVSVSPVMFPGSKTLSRVEDEIRERPDERFAVGLSNVGHLAWARSLCSLEHVSFYIDYGLYVANLCALRFLAETVPRLRGAYLWLEANDRQRAALAERITSVFGSMPLGIRFVDEKERFPMFISRICFKRAEDGQCPKTCPKDFSYRLRQQQRMLDVRVRSCITYTHLGSAKSPRKSSL